MDEKTLLKKLKAIHKKLEQAGIFHDRYMLHSAEDELDELIKEIEKNSGKIKGRIVYGNDIKFSEMDESEDGKS